MADMQKPELLYSSREIHSRIKDLFGEPNARDRRVALVAYIGTDALDYLPHPKRLRVICNPSAGGTDPNALRQLQSAGAEVQISDRLHMKVYWSRQRGCVLTSANASSNALGRDSLKEAGIWLPPGKVDVDRLIRYAKPKELTAGDLRRLDRDSKHTLLFPKTGAQKHAVAPDFREWYSARYPSDWKLACIDSLLSGSAQTVKAETEAAYGHRDPHSWVSVAKGRVRRNDWLLSFILTDNGPANLTWLYTDFVVKLRPKDKRFYSRANPYNAVQVNPASKYPLPPFRITPAFRKALGTAIQSYPAERLDSAQAARPPARLLRLISNALAPG